MIPSDQIRSSYFGSRSQAEPTVAFRTTSREITPAARFILKEARKKISSEFSDDERIEEQELISLLQQIEQSHGELLSDLERTSLVALLQSSLEHYGILTPLVETAEVNDIIVRAFDDVSVQIGRRNVQTDVRFADRDAYAAFVENLLKRAGKACTMATPVVDAAIDPHVRACVTHESFSPPGSGPMLTLRIARHRTVTLNELAQHELAPEEILHYLGGIVEQGKGSLLIAGEVGTGKTTLVRALSTRIAEDEAVLVIEDTHEIDLQRAFTRTLLTREANTEGAGRISPAQAIRTGMRMAMNRIILGEMRDAETAEAFVDVCASGHPGMSTIHARSARDAVLRLELFLSRAQAGVGMETIRRQIANAISVVVFLDLDPSNKKRRIISVLEVESAADGAVQLSPIYSFAPSVQGVPTWSRDSGVSKHQENLSTPGTSLRFCPEEQYRRVQRERGR